VPANRSRTLEWRRCLRQVYERGGSLEIAVAPDAEVADAPQHLVWRVRLIGLSETEIVVEQPTALGQSITINPGTNLVVVLSIGQNRWMFTTSNLGVVQQVGSDRRFTPALRLAMPESVQRCQRRTHYRVETASLTLPQVELWPLLDAKSVLVAERAYEIQYEIDLARQNETGGVIGAGNAEVFDHDSVMPEVGPKFAGTLLNLGGGGVGLRVGPQDAQALGRHKLLWMRIFLPPTLATPICATGKVVHTHMESNHDTYAGVAFDFSFNPSHQRFVIDQICRYIALQQRMELQMFRPQERRKTG
jgi:c-di-GMP-binding flagellar brake protein YcgR